ncbi:hypothetical protein ACGF7W_18395 [Streptomyces sp. NPDC048219]|uniref:hypothetical protein n=1 Tax=Streptomyces sp. NPDC048219 TaxID=3365517 RepID=UPI003721B372
MPIENPTSLPPSAGPGTRMVHEALGASPHAIARLQAGEAETALADLLYTAARHLDHVHQQFVDAASRAADTLTRAASANTSINSLGVLQNSGIQIDILAARRSDAVDNLRETIRAYREGTAPQAASRQAPGARAVPAPAPASTPSTRVTRGR